MKICIVADVLGEPNNGTSLACYNLADHLRKAGWNVRIVCSDDDKKDREGYYIVGKYNLGYFLNRYLEKNKVVLSKPDSEVLETALSGVDICHLMMPFALARAALRICRKRNIPVTAGFHCQAQNISAHIGMMNFPTANRVIYYNFYYTFYRYVDAVHFPTKFIKNTFEDAVNKKVNSYVISNGVNDRYRKIDCEKKPYQIITSGRYSREKSHHLLLEALAKSRFKDKITLIFAGQGPLKNKMKEQVRELKLKNVIMKFYDKEELVRVINESVLYVHPAKVEIESISCLEAIRCGLVPVLSDSKDSATKNFALTEMNLFEYGNTDDLRDKIDFWLENDDLREKCSKKYLGYTERFRHEDCMRKMEKMLVKVIKDHEG